MLVLQGLSLFIKGEWPLPDEFTVYPVSCCTPPNGEPEFTDGATSDLVSIGSIAGLTTLVIDGTTVAKIYYLYL